MNLLKWLRREVTPTDAKRLEEEQAELLKRLRRQLTAERKVMRFDR